MQTTLWCFLDLVLSHFAKHFLCFLSKEILFRLNPIHLIHYFILQIITDTLDPNRHVSSLNQLVALRVKLFLCFHCTAVLSAELLDFLLLLILVNLLPA